MAADRVEREVLIEVPIDVVWEVITEPEHIVRWFSDAAEMDLRPGGAGTYTWAAMPTSQQPASWPLRFEVVEPPRRLTYRWIHEPDETPRPGNSTLVEFSLSEEGTGTRLRVVESGIEVMPWPEAERDHFADSHGDGWTRHLERLRIYGPVAAAERSVR